MRTTADTIEGLRDLAKRGGMATTWLMVEAADRLEQFIAELDLLRSQRQTLLQMLNHIDGIGDRHNAPYPQASWVSSDTIRDILGSELHNPRG